MPKSFSISWPIFSASYCVGLFGTLANATKTDPNSCPSIAALVYSPFKPWFVFYADDYPGANQRCWTCSICLLQIADEARKQQFSATSLVMGLLPLLLKDIAWPERRVIRVSKLLPIPFEILVRAFGLVPTPVDAHTPTVASWARHSSYLTKAAYRLRKRYVIMWIGLCSIALATGYAATVLVEFYSKRSSLGCVFPAFVMSWHIVALIPATVQTLSSRATWTGLSRSKVQSDQQRHQSTPTVSPSTQQIFFTLPTGLTFDKGASAVQGAEDNWFVQLSWAVYYMAGTLVYTSIMAVTVIELFAWTVVAMIVASTAKMVAMFLCLAFEDTGKHFLDDLTEMAAMSVPALTVHAMGKQSSPDLSR